MPTFDFQDGNGPVPAHRHPNGGGWVAGTALVAPTAFVGPDARVFGNAQVTWNAEVFDRAQVYDNAWVSDDALVSGNAQVFGNARVYGPSVVTGSARVYGSAKVYGNASLTSGDYDKGSHTRVQGGSGGASSRGGTSSTRGPNLKLDFDAGSGDGISGLPSWTQPPRRRR